MNKNVQLVHKHLEKSHRGFGEEESCQPAMLLLPFLLEVVAVVVADADGLRAGNDSIEFFSGRANILLRCGQKHPS